MRTLEIDIETFSSVSLQKCGVYKYAESPDLQIILFGYSVDGSEVKVVDLLQGETIPQEIFNALTDDTVVKWAHNSGFERVCLSRYLADMGVSLDPFHDNHPLPQENTQFLNPSSWRCSMTWAAYLGLPLSLSGVGEILGLEKKKLTEGKELIKFFCQPCAPTKANGGRTRNLPSDAPEKWESFKSYNLRDVEVEMQITQRLAKFPVPDSVWDEYHLSEEINDRGVGVDMPFVSACLSLDVRSTDALTEAMRELTALENPNSVAQIKGWLADNGLDIDTLGKKEVSAQLKTAPAELVPVLQLRQQLAKSSVKKYTAIENAVCTDSRVRGMFMFLGASRTGRFAGRLVQLQNLPQNHIPDLDEARALAGAEDYDALEMLYEDIPDTKGTWDGKPFELIDWQEQIIRDIFGILKPNGYRQFNTAYIEIPKKQGKSELAAAVALYLLCADFEPGAEVYGCAADKDQARIVFDVAMDMVKRCPHLFNKMSIQASLKTMNYVPTGSKYKALSADVANKHGFNTHGVIFDELHTQPNRKLYDVMLQGSGDARMQPLYFLITTAGNNQNSICWEVHQKALDIIDGRKHDSSFYPVIYGAAQEDDWSDPKVWKKANPSLGITVSMDKVKAAFESARQNPAEENSFRQLRLNQWVKQAVRWMPMDKWDACAFTVDPEALQGRVCYGGLDLSSSTDITAFVLVFPPINEDDRYIVLPFFWISNDSYPLLVIWCSNE